MALSPSFSRVYKIMYLVSLMRAAVEEGTEQVDVGDMNLIQDVSPGLVQPLPSRDVCAAG